MDTRARPARLAPVALAELAATLDAGRDCEAGTVEVSGVTLSSTEVRRGDLFAALPGARTHGIAYAAAALEAGAVAVLTDPAGARVLAEVEPAVPVLVTADPREAVGRVAAVVYGDPSRRLSVLGVTGTNGKTTTCYLLEAALTAAGEPAGLIGTIETRMQTADGPIATPATRTTPESPELQASLALMAEHGVGWVAMEVSSHALALDRVSGTQFAVAGFTNFSQDHLDFHDDLEAYFAAKASLFDGRAAREVVTVDDDWARRLVSARTVTVSAAGDKAASWQSADVRIEGGMTLFTAYGPQRPALPVTLGPPGDFNVANALLALAMLDSAGVDVAAAAAGLASARVPGRMEVVDAGQPFSVVVDYAHTPAAVASVLAALAPQTEAALIVVLGCGGDRDRGKRSRMGEAAARGSDLLIITDDNPRTEDPAAIRAAMRSGALHLRSGRRGQVVEVAGRAQAIEVAVGRAAPGDTVLIAGKGHEQGQEAMGVVTPFDDRQVLRNVLAAHGWTGDEPP